MKKRGFGKDKWNGAGGKVEEGESVEDAAKIETLEEIGVEVKDLSKVAELYFTFSKKPEWNQKVYAFFSEKWEGEIVESEEMNPDWFSINKIPFENMWRGDKNWLLEVLNNKLVKAYITFGDNHVLEKEEISLIENF